MMENRTVIIFLRMYVNDNGLPGEKS